MIMIIQNFGLDYFIVAEKKMLFLGQTFRLLWTFPHQEANGVKRNQLRRCLCFSTDSLTCVDFNLIEIRRAATTDMATVSRAHQTYSRRWLREDLESRAILWKRTLMIMANRKIATPKILQNKGYSKIKSNIRFSQWEQY